jgi:hypothetical protein
MCNSSDDQTYALLERNNLVVPVHLRTILSSLNYVGLHVLSKITDKDYDEIITGVKEILADPELLAGKTDDELKNTFGPLYFNRPKKFTLLPGDKKMLQEISVLCSKIVGQSPLVVEVKQPVNNSKVKKTAKSEYFQTNIFASFF